MTRAEPQGRRPRARHRRPDRRLRLPGDRGAVLPAAALDHGRHLAQDDGGGPAGQHPGLAAASSRCEPWIEAWAKACTGLDCNGIRVGFWNSVRILVPSVIVSIAVGAVTGYALVVLARARRQLAVRHPAARRLHPLPDLPLPAGPALLAGGHLQFAGLHRHRPRHLRPAGDDAAVPQLLRRRCRSSCSRPRAIDGGGFWTIFLRVILPMSTPILVVAAILQVTGIWNDFIFGLTFAGRENLPMTVQLNNIVNSTQGERAYNVDMAATHADRAGAARRLLRLRALVRARHRRRCGEGLTPWVPSPSATSRWPSSPCGCSIGLSLEVEQRRVPRAARPLGLRQVHPAQRHRRPARRRHRADLDRRAQRHLGGAQGPRHRHGLPVLRALSAHDRCARTCPSACAWPRRPGPRSTKRVAGGGRCCRSSICSTAAPTSSPGGQRQRVAIGRALVRDADVFLFDEPLSNLDAQLRNELRVEIKRLHQRLGSTTMIYVTHDQIEALTLADRIAVMKDQQIQQLGTPDGDLPPAGQPLRRRLRRQPAHELRRGRAGGRPPTFVCGDRRLPLDGYAFGDATAAGPEGDAGGPARASGDRRRPGPASRSSWSSPWGPTISSGAATAISRSNCACPASA